MNADDILTHDIISREAEQLLLQSGFAGQFPVPVDKIAEFLNYTAFYFQPSDNTRQISGAVDHQKKRIYINPSESLERRIFTLAHEIGHIILHGKSKDYIDYRTTVTLNNPKENEADHFAGCLLMPGSVFKRQWELSSGNVEALASFFGVSKPAVGVRASKLNLG